MTVRFIARPMFGLALLALLAVGAGAAKTAHQLRTRLPDSPILTAPDLMAIPGMAARFDSNKMLRRASGSFESLAPTHSAAARAFVQANERLIGVASSNLVMTRELESLTGRHMRFEQRYNGLPVFGAIADVHTNRWGAVRGASFDLQRIERADLSTRVAKDAAVANAVAAVPAKGAHSQQATLGVLARDGEGAAAWRVTFLTRSPGADWEVMVSASTGAVLGVRNMACYVDGQGMVYEPNPVVTSGIANLTDQNNQDYSTLTDERDQVTLPGLDGSGRLQGTYATTAPSTKITRAYNASNQFLFTRSQSGFDETMCYYHVDHDERYIQSLGFNNINNRQVGIDVNGITDDNSFYSPSTKRVTFGTGGVNDAQDSDVIWHEMGHAIQDNQVPGWGSSHEGGSMGEGFGDYWAGSESAGVGPMAPGWDVYVAEWDAVSYNPGNPAYLRVLNSTKHYPEDMEYQVHADGEIWSAVIWQVRGLVGRARGDTLVLESHFSVPTTGTFEDGANAIIQANRDLYGGADEAAIRTLFVQRGILESIAAPTNLTANLEGSNAIRLDWQDNSAEETGFRVERKVNAGSWQTAGSVGPNVETYLDANLDPWTRYTYRVVATSTMGDSKASNEAGLRTPPASYTISGQTRTQLGAAIPGVIIDGSGFQSVTNQQTVNANLNIPDNNTSGVTSNLAWSLAGTVMDIQVYVNITHTWIGDLEVSVIGPTGTTVMLHNRTGGSADNLVTSYPDQTQPAQSLDAFIGKLAQGTWKLKVRDLASQDTGKLNSWRLTLMTNSGVTFTATTGGDGTFSIGNLLNGATEIHLRNPKGKWTPRSYNLNLTGDVGGLDFTRRDPIIRP